MRREVMEEVGLRVKDIRYYGSQPWGMDSQFADGLLCPSGWGRLRFTWTGRSCPKQDGTAGMRFRCGRMGTV